MKKTKKQTKKKKILIIEDEEMIKSMYKTKFEADGFEVFAVGSGSEGLEIAKTEKPDLILLDVILPQLDGFSILKELRAHEATKKIFVSMLTNLGTEEDKKKGEELGANDYLVKATLTPAQISDKVKEYFKKIK